MSDVSEILEKWRGEKKVRFTKMDRLDNGSYLLQFSEGRRKAGTITAESLGEADALRQEFGGKNEETYATKPELLKLFKGFGAHIMDLDHSILKMNLVGSRKDSKDISKIEIPEECGTKTTLRGSKAISDGMIKKSNIRRISTETFTMQFENNSEVDALIDFLQNAEEFAGFDWYVHNLVTINNELKVNCKWLRKKAGDGSKSMELQLHFLDGKFYQECMVYDLTAAADELIYKECRLVNLKKQAPTAWICADALEQGKIDQEGKKVSKK